MRPQGAFATERPWREAHRDETGVSLFRVIRLVLLFLSACFFYSILFFLNHAFWRFSVRGHYREKVAIWSRVVQFSC